MLHHLGGKGLPGRYRGGRVRGHDIRSPERYLGHDPSEIRTIVQTHSHPDHIGSTKAIKGASNCDVMIHNEERRWLEDIETQFAERPVPGFHGLVGGSVSVDRALNDGDRIELGDGLTLEVIHTPGHSSGSISLFLREEGVLITGDAVPLVGEMPVYEDATASMRSVERLLGIDGVKVLLGSWDAPRYGDEVRRVLGDALGYLEKIDRTVKEIAARDQCISSTYFAERSLMRWACTRSQPYRWWPGLFSRTSCHKMEPDFRTSTIPPMDRRFNLPQRSNPLSKQSAVGPSTWRSMALIGNVRPGAGRAE